MSTYSDPQRLCAVCERPLPQGRPSYKVCVLCDKARGGFIRPLEAIIWTLHSNVPYDASPAKAAMAPIRAAEALRDQMIASARGGKP